MAKSILLAGILTIGAIGGLAQSRGNFTGEIMDSSCAKMGSHAMMEKEHNIPHNAADCTHACVKAGAKYVLYDAATKKTYALDDQSKPAAFAGQNVKVNGTLDSATDTIHVNSVGPAS